MHSDHTADPRPRLPGLDSDSFRREPGYLSLRWKLIIPLFAVLLTFSMVITYVVTDALVRRGQVSRTTQVQLAARGAMGGAQALYDRLVNESVRLAFTDGVAAALTDGDADVLRRLLEPGALAADLDLVVAVDDGGMAVAGLQRGTTPLATYAVAQGVDLGAQPLAEVGQGGASALLRTPEGYMVVAAHPIYSGGGAIGQVWVGAYLADVLDSLRSSGLAQVALFGGDGSLLQTTFRAEGDWYDTLRLSPQVVAQTLADPDGVPVYSVPVAGYTYLAGYFPLTFGQTVLGTAGVFVPDSLPYAIDLGRHLLGLLLAGMTAVVVIGGYVAVARVLGRVQRVTRTAQALAGGDIGARTGYRVVDEVGELGRSLDVYAQRVQMRQDRLRADLRRQRREAARLAAVLEAIPDGVVMLDAEGRVMLMNDAAHDLLGSQRAFREAFAGLFAAGGQIGDALAPGLYTLGEPQRATVNDRHLSAHAAAILNVDGQQAGTAVVIRDVTDAVRQEQARESLLQALARDVQEPLLDLVQKRSSADADPPLQRFAYEVMRGMIRLQRVVNRFQDLADFGPEEVEAGQQSLSVAALVEGLTAEWRSTIQAADLTLKTHFDAESLCVLGDERRLRWALGNLIDNAVKYTLPGGTVAVGATTVEQDKARIVVADSGVGIAPEDMDRLFDRFARGTPRLPSGEVLDVPGVGQGLFIAQRVIEAHGGTLTIESRPGQGTRAACTLPLTAPVALSLADTPLPTAAPAETHRE